MNSNNNVFYWIVLAVAVVITAVVTWRVKPTEKAEPVEIVKTESVQAKEDVSDSLQRKLDLRDVQLGSAENMLTILYKKATDEKNISNQYKGVATAWKQRYDSISTLQNCDSALRVAWDEIYQAGIYERTLTATVDSQRWVIDSLYAYKRIQGMQVDTLRAALKESWVDAKALNYYRRWCREHGFRRWLVGIRVE